MPMKRLATSRRSKKVIKKVVLNESKIIGIGTKNQGIAGYQGGVS